MRHAILLLAHRSFIQIKYWIEQFENNENIDIYIHIDKKLKLTKEEKKELLSNENVKLIISKINCKYCTFSIVKATNLLINAAYNAEVEYDYYHLFSEECYLLCSPEYFLNFFEIHNTYSFIEWAKVPNNNKLISNECHNLKGSQWWSLYKTDIASIIELNCIWEPVYDKNTRPNKRLKNGAFDEMYYQCLLIGTNNKYGIIDTHYINNSLRFVDWPIYDHILHPSVLISNAKHDYDIAGTDIIVRKIDITNNYSLEMLNQLKKTFFEKHEA